MGKIVKGLLYLLGALLTLIIVLAIAIPLFVDPNDYRDEIGAMVKKETGRNLDIAGEIQLSLFPWIGIKLGEMSLSNATGFGERPFARVEKVEVKIKLLPLLRQQLEMDTIVLRGMKLNLAKNSQGTPNWSDLIKPADHLPSSPKSPGPLAGGPKDAQAISPSKMLAALAIGGLEILDANILWDDQSLQQKIDINQFNLVTGAISLDSQFPLELDFNTMIYMGDEAPQIEAGISLKSLVGLNIKQQRYKLDQLRLTTDLKSQQLPDGQLKSVIEGNFAADLSQQTARTEELTIKALGTVLTISSNISQLDKSPVVNGSIGLKVTEAAPIIKLLGDALPKNISKEMIEATTLSTSFSVDTGRQVARTNGFTLNIMGTVLTLNTDISRIDQNPVVNGNIDLKIAQATPLKTLLGDALPKTITTKMLETTVLNSEFGINTGSQKVALEKFRLTFDQSTINGSASATHFDKPAIRYRFDIDHINIDRYFPPGANEPKPATATKKNIPTVAPSDEPLPIPVELLRTLDIDGTLRLGTLQVMNLHTRKIVTTVKAKGGVLTLAPLSAELYQGKFDGVVKLDLRNDVPIFKVDERLTGVQAGPLFKDLLGKDYVTGKALLTANVTTSGDRLSQFKKGLNGQAKLRFEDGSVKGIDIAQLIREANAKYKGQPVEKLSEKPKTDFALLSATINIKDGLVSNNDLSAKSPLLRVNGSGQANLVTEKIDYKVKAAIVSTLEGQGGRAISELKGLTIPVTIKGTFSAPKFGVDLAQLLDEKAKAKIAASKKRARQELQQKIDSKKKSLKNRLREKFKFKF